MLSLLSRDWALTDCTLAIPEGSTDSRRPDPACDTGTQQQCNFWIAGQHLRQVVSYQPASRYWALRVRPGSPHGYRVGGCQVGGCQSVRRLDG